MSVDSLIVFFPFALVVVLTIFCTVALCKHFCKADTTQTETFQNRRIFSANLLRENSDATDSQRRSNKSILVSSDRNQITSSVSQSNNIPTTTDYSASYNMSSNVTRNSTRSNIFSRASSGLEWLNIPPRVSINDARGRNSAAAPTFVQNEDLNSGVPNVYSHGAIYDSFNRNNTESTNSSVRSNFILADPRNYGDDTIYPTGSYVFSMASRDSTSSVVPLHISMNGESEINNETVSSLPRNENLFSRVPSLYSHGAVFDSFYRNNAESISNGILSDPKNYGDDTIYPISSYVSSMSSRDSTSFGVPFHVSVNGECERSNRTASILPRNENLFSRVPSLHSHGVVFDSLNRDHAETHCDGSSTFLVDPRTEGNDTIYSTSRYEPLESSRDSTASDVPLDVSINNECERSNATASIALRNDLFSRVPCLNCPSSVFDSQHRNNAEGSNTSVSSNASLEDPRTVEDDSSNVFPIATSGSTVLHLLPQASINGERERSSTAASTVMQNEDLFSRVPSVYSHGSVFDSLYRNNEAVPDNFSNSNDIDSRTNWDFTNYSDFNSFTTDQPPNYSDVLLAASIESQVEYFLVPSSLPETPPPSYEENMRYQYIF